MRPAWTADAKPPPVFWLILFGLPVAFLTVMQILESGAGVDEKWRVTFLEGMTSDVEYESPPPPDVDWHGVDLPFAPILHGTPTTGVWWRVPIPRELRHPRTHWLVIVPIPFFANYELWVENRLLARAGTRDPIGSTPKNPVTFEVTNPAEGLPAEFFYLRTTVDRAGLMMSPIWVGPAEVLTSLATRLDRIHRTTIRAIMATMAMMAFIMGAIQLLRRRPDDAYGWYALMLLIWTLHLGHRQNEAPAFGDVNFWVLASQLTLGWFVIAAAIFINRYLKQRDALVERLLLAWGALIPAILLFAELPSALSFTLSGKVWVASVILIGVYMLVRVLRDFWRKPSTDNCSLLALVFFLIVIGLRDYYFNEWAGPPLQSFLYLPFASGIALLTFSIMLIRNFVVALETSETLNVELEARVAEKVDALEQEHALRRQMEQEQLLMQERQRLLQEMHDGLGGHLVHALATAERAPQLESMVDPLKTALEDLRLIIDSLDPEEGTFEAVFSSLRARVARTVDALGMEFTWQLDPALDALELNPHEVLNLARIIQEAVTNVVKHAHATALTVTGTYEPISRTATFRVQDDGNGFTTNGDGGRGMTSMHGRAAELQGTLSVASGRHGTRITVTFSR